MRMEDLLDLYALPYDPRYPVICFDERPCQLLGETLVPVPMQPGTCYKYDYHYERHGVCTVFIAVEPLTGFRFVQVRAQRTKTDYAEFMQALAQLPRYAEAVQLRVVQDNLNTHTAGSLYAAFEPDEAWRLKQRFEYHFTPTNGSWLNMAELELSAISRQCLHQRIPDQALLERNVLACVKERNLNEIKILWRFTRSQAREKLKRHYQAVRNGVEEHDSHQEHSQSLLLPCTI